VLFPSLPHVRSTVYPFVDIHDFVERVVASTNAEFIDLTTPLRESDIENLTVSKYDSHPSEDVHRLVAFEIEKLIVDKGLLNRLLSAESS
jgi:hypothetical protein